MDVASYFKQTIERKGSDLHLAAGSAPSMRLSGELVKLDQIELGPNELKDAVFSLISQEKKEKFELEKELDFSQEFFGSRFRINLHYQEGGIGLTARMIPSNVPSPEDLGFDESIYKLTHLQDGLILVTGATGSGKSTTLACMIDIINRERRAHIITIEDPIEYLFKEKQSLIEQRELLSDTKDFASALKYALRQDPNVIMVGEMRDAETVAGVMTAAETGHLVLSTLHTSTAIETIARIVDIFPSQQHDQVLSQLSLILRVIITQQLLPRKDGGVVAAREILINNSAVSNLIRRNQQGQIYSILETGQREGMITMNKSINELLKRGLISEDVARNRLRDLETHASYY